MDNRKKIALGVIIIAIIIAIVVFFLMRDTEKVFTVTFKNGDEIVDTVKVKKGNTVEQPKGLVDTDDNIFMGWYLEDEKFDFDTKINKDITLVAKWQGKDDKKIYTITIDVDGKTSTINTNELGILSRPKTPIKDGYEFIGWYIGKEKVDFSKPFTSDSTIVAKFVKKTNSKPSEPEKPTEPTNPDKPTEPETSEYTIKFMVDGKVISTLKVDKGTKLTLPKTPSKTGYTFNGWYLDNEKVTSDTLVNDNMTITGKWDQYTFEVSMINNDKHSVNRIVKAYKNGNVVSISAIYGKLDSVSEYKLGLYSSSLKNVKIASYEQFKTASNYKLELNNGTKVFANEL